MCKTPLVRPRAAARSAVLRTRVNVMRALTAMTAHQFACLKHQSALVERRGCDIATNEHMLEAAMELTAANNAVKQAADNGASPAAAAIASKDVAVGEQNLAAALSDRTLALESINERIALLAMDRERSAFAVQDAMKVLGVQAADLRDLVPLTGVPEAAEILTCATPALRHARAACLLDAMESESRRADEELGQVGGSHGYDLALIEQLDAEEAHHRARHDAEQAAARRDDAFRALCSAQRRLADARRGIASAATRISP